MKLFTGSSNPEGFVVEFDYKGHKACVSINSQGKYTTGYDRYFFEKSSLKALRSEFENYIDYAYPTTK
jgi:hypothetical protein